MDTTTSQIYGLLRRLGATANYIGFFHMAYALQLCVEEQERLLLITKLLYPDVAKRYGTTWKAVERNIRTVTSIIWESNQPLVEALAHRSLPEKPSTAQFLAILSASLPCGGDLPPAPASNSSAQHEQNQPALLPSLTAV